MTTILGDYSAGVLGDYDYTPNIVDPFTFDPVFGAEISTLTSSNTVAVTGDPFEQPISIVGGEYSIDGGAFTSTAGTFIVGTNSDITVRTTSSASFLTKVIAILTIDSLDIPFEVTTRIETPSAIAIIRQALVNLGTLE